MKNKVYFFILIIATLFCQVKIITNSCVSMMANCVNNFLLFLPLYLLLLNFANTYILPSLDIFVKKLIYNLIILMLLINQIEY